MEKKLLILILSTQDKTYQGFIKACMDTWLNNVKKHSINYLFYVGNSLKEEIVENTLFLKANDSLIGTSEKLLKAFEFLEKEKIQYDFIYRTNLSSFIYLENLLDYLNNNNGPKLYAGKKGKYLDRKINSFFSRIISKIFRKNIIEFASGSGFFISRQNVQLVLADRNVDLSLIDDVMIGKSLSKFNIQITNCSRIDLNDDLITYSKDIRNEPNLIAKCHHIRLKSKDRKEDIERFYILNEYKDFSESSYKNNIKV